MAGNLQADNSGNILVDFDYQNLIVVDPNKTIDSFGNIRERIVDHENLVMFVNLEAEVIPRTKLAVGGSPEDRIRTISVAKINFLKPTKNSYLGTGYYDDLTGENSTKYQAVNQPKQVPINPGNGEKPYIINTVADETNVIDTGLLGITSISIKTSTSFIPSVTIELEDVQGRALFQLGNNSPYSAFFNLPYCPFYLTLKGYYGQAIRYQLNLERFAARFNSTSGNYQVTLDFKGYKFNILNEISFGHLLAAPHMYSQRFQTTQSTTESQSAQQEKDTATIQTQLNLINQANSTNNVTTGNITDPFALMNASINDPGALQESIAKAAQAYTTFDEKTKTFKMNPQGMLTLRQMAKETGMSYENLSKMGLAAADLDKRLSQISPTLNFKDESDKQFLSNLGEMDASGNYVVKINDSQSKNLADVTQEEFDKLIDEQKKAPKTMEDIAKASMKSGEILVNEVTAIKEAIVRGAVSTSVVKDNLESFRRIITVPATAGANTFAKTELFNEQFEKASNSLRDAAAQMADKNNKKPVGDIISDLASKLKDQGGEVKSIFLNLLP